MEWTDYIVPIITGLAIIIALIAKMYEYYSMLIAEKRWPELLNTLMNYMVEAESKFSTGAERKEWVLSMIQTSAEIVNYTVDLELIGMMIDNLCTMAKKVNQTRNKAAK